MAIIVLLLLLTGCGKNLNVSDLNDAQIVIAQNAVPSERYAAKEFRRLFAKISGKLLPIVVKPETNRFSVFIGSSDELRKSTVAIADDDLGEEGLRIKIGGDAIAVVGGKPRGVLYGVYEFFERYFDVRFLTADHTYIPKNAAGKMLPLETYSYKPVFIFRFPYYGEVKNNPVFAARLRVNTIPTAGNLGGISRQRLINHSFYRQLPAKKYGKEHPEYFAFFRGKRRIKMFGGGPQPCVSNPEVIDIVTRAVLDEIKKSPDFINYSVSQNDNDAYCRCEKCQAINQAEGSPMGAHLRFVNEVASRVKKVYPEKKIGTLAYWYTRKPPKNLKPADNVQIQLADIESCRLHAIDDPDCSKNRGFLNDLKGWSEKTDQLFMWTYMTDFRYYDLPFPNLKTIGKNFKFYADHGVKGVFAQAHGGSTSGDLSDLRAYVIARCLWNPKLNSWEEAKEFCRLHYGKAAPAIIEYLEYVQRNAEEKGVHPDCFATPKQLGLDRQAALEILKIFKRALALAENDTIRRRVEKISISGYRTLLEAGAEFEVREGKLKRLYPPEYPNPAETYLRLAKTYKLTMPDERTKLKDFEKILRTQYQEGIPVNVLENEFWRIVINPADNGKFLEMTYKPEKINFLVAYNANLRYGTFEEWFGEAADFEAQPGAFTAEGNGEMVRLKRKLSNGAEYIREIRFDPQNPQIIRCLTRFIHYNKKPNTYQIVVHPEFYVGSDSDDHRVIGAYVKQNGMLKIYNRGLFQDRGPDAALLKQCVKGGFHAFFNHQKGFGLLETYDPEKAETLRTWWVPQQMQLNLEIQTKPVVLKQGEKWEFGYQFQFLKKIEKE